MTLLRYVDAATGRETPLPPFSPRPQEVRESAPLTGPGPHR